MQLEMYLHIVFLQIHAKCAHSGLQLIYFHAWVHDVDVYYITCRCNWRCIFILYFYKYMQGAHIVACSWCAVDIFSCLSTCTWWQRPIGYFISIGHIPQKSFIISGSFARRLHSILMMSVNVPSYSRQSCLPWAMLVDTKFQDKHW